MVQSCTPNTAIAKVLLTGGLRPDFRFVDECRPLSIEFPPRWNCATARLGKTAVSATISCDLVTPSERSPKLGLIRCYVSDSCLATPPNFAARSSAAVDTDRIAHSLNSLLKGPAGIGLDSLCVIAGVAVWCITVDVRVLNNDGNVHDTAIAAAAAALRVARRSEVVARAGVAYLDRARPPVELAGALLNLPLSVTLAIDAASQVVLVDPSNSDITSSSQSSSTVSIIAYDASVGLKGASTAAVVGGGRCSRKQSPPPVVVPPTGEERATALPNWIPSAEIIKSTSTGDADSTSVEGAFTEPNIDEVVLLRFEMESGHAHLAPHAITACSLAAVRVSAKMRAVINDAADAHARSLRAKKREIFAPVLK